MRLEHRLDRGRADAALDPVDDALAFDEHERGNIRDLEALRELGLLLDVDADHAEPRPFLAGEMREQALHPPRWSRALGAEEDEQRLHVIARADVFSSVGSAGSGIVLFPANGPRKQCPFKSRRT